MTPENPVIDMQDVSAGSLQGGSELVAEAIRWNVRPGDYWVIAGLQGSGKSDFLMMTGGLMAPLSGRYLLFGEPMPMFDAARLPQRLRVALVFENGQLFHHLTVRENVSLPLRYHQNLSPAAARPAIDALLEATELTPYAESTPGSLARQWQKRVGLARALVLHPEVLLVDNPLAGLDLRHANWWLDFLEKLSTGHGILPGKPLTLVVTAADLRPWKGRAKQFAILQGHRLHVLGTWGQVEAANRELVDEVLGSLQE